MISNELKLPRTISIIERPLISCSWADHHLLFPSRHGVSAPPQPQIQISPQALTNDKSHTSQKKQEFGYSCWHYLFLKRSVLKPIVCDIFYGALVCKRTMGNESFMLPLMVVKCNLSHIRMTVQLSHRPKLFSQEVIDFMGWWRRWNKMVTDVFC
jgi:hypothetical protein